MAGDASVARLTEEPHEPLVRRVEPQAVRVDIKVPQYDDKADVELLVRQFHDVAEQSG